MHLTITYTLKRISVGFYGMTCEVRNRTSNESSNKTK